MAIVEPRIEDLESAKAEWLDRLDAFFAEIEGWAEASGWRVRRDTTRVRDLDSSRYTAPLLSIERGDVELILSPIARPIPASPGSSIFI